MTSAATLAVAAPPTLARTPPVASEMPADDAAVVPAPPAATLAEPAKAAPPDEPAPAPVAPVAAVAPAPVAPAAPNGNAPCSAAGTGTLCTISPSPTAAALHVLTVLLQVGQWAAWPSTRRRSASLSSPPTAARAASRATVHAAAGRSVVNSPYRVRNDSRARNSRVSVAPRETPRMPAISSWRRPWMSLSTSTVRCRSERSPSVRSTNWLISACSKVSMGHRLRVGDRGRYRDGPCACADGRSRHSRPRDRATA